MALILCTGTDHALMETRKLILEQAGHKVVTASDEQQLASECRRHSFDVAVIGQMATPDTKQFLMKMVRHYCPSVKVLELFQTYGGKALKDADSWLEVPLQAPSELAERVNELAGKR